VNCDYDYLLVGGGLQNGLIALCLHAARPGVHVGIVEQGTRLGGNHTWCFHESDVDAKLMKILEPTVLRRWQGYRIRFPRLERTIAQTYCMIQSAGFHEVVVAQMAVSGCTVLLGRKVCSIESHYVELDSGSRLTAKVVVDSRGPLETPGKPIGYQKFLGLELVLQEPTDDTLVTLMDATVAQIDGFRFFYVLPISPKRVLIEDTYYSDSPQLALDHLRNEVLNYAAHCGMKVGAVEREETGVLPLFDSAPPSARTTRVLAGGYQGGFFHPTTGYSLPSAARLAQHISRTQTHQIFGKEWLGLVDEHARQARFCFWLNRMLFGAFRPEERFNVLERFYGLPEETVQRFYALQMTTLDKARLVCGRPPRGFSLRRALQRSKNS
jgi:lycopene beta-cyclase